MTIHELLESLNAVDHVEAVCYMDFTYGPSNPFADKMEWLIDIERHDQIEVATIKLVQGVFVVDSFIHRYMQIREVYEPLTEVIQRIELSSSIAIDLNLN